MTVLSKMNYLTLTFSTGVHALIFHTNFQMELQKHFTYLEFNYLQTPGTQTKSISAGKVMS